MESFTTKITNEIFYILFLYCFLKSELHFTTISQIGLDTCDS